MKVKIAHRHLTGASLAVMASMALAGMAQAQDAAAPPAPAAAPQAQTEDAGAPRSADIVVTGSRITTSGFNAPTPTTVIGEEQIINNAQPNVFNTIAQLPRCRGRPARRPAPSARRAACRASVPSPCAASSRSAP